MIDWLKATLIMRPLLREPVKHFDGNWYRSHYRDVGASGMDALTHYLLYGWREGRNPSAWFSTRAFLGASPGRQENLRRWSDAIVGRERRRGIERYESAQRDLAREYEGVKKLIVFFTVAEDVVNGGMLSINRFTEATQELFAGQTDTRVAVSGVPLVNPSVTHTQFKAALPQIAFQFLAEHTDPEEVWLFIPEVYAVHWGEALTEMQRAWVHGRPRAEIVILNQNNDLMPSPLELDAAFADFTHNIRITTAHERYCTQALASRYGLPVKQLTPILPSVPKRGHAQKSPVFMLSPDQPRSEAGGLSRDAIVSHLKKDLPEFDFVTVKNLTLDQYLELASRAAFSLTLGEGVDGYFVEPILGGGISFAIYNSVFFPPDFREAPTVFNSWQEFLARAPGMIRALWKSPDEYDARSAELQSLLARHFTRTRSVRELSEVFAGRYDHVPGPLRELVEDDGDSAVRAFEAGTEFRFYKIDQAGEYIGTPDRLLLHPAPGGFHAELDRIYRAKHYDIELDTSRDYILIDIGSGAGAATAYLLARHPNIRSAFAFEPSDPLARLAHVNFRNNDLLTRVKLSTVGLSDSFERRESNVLSGAGRVESEFAPGASEIGPILRRRGEARVVLRCSADGEESRIIDNLDRAGLLAEVDLLIVEAGRATSSLLVERLTAAGFQSVTNLDDASNLVHTLHASGHDNRAPARGAA